LRDSLDTVYTEPASFWLNIATDTSYNAYHRAVCAQLVFKRCIDSGTVLNDVCAGGELKNCIEKVELAFNDDLQNKRYYEYQDTAKTYVEFRCVMTYLGRNSGNSEARKLKLKGYDVYHIYIKPTGFRYHTTYPCSSIDVYLAFKNKTNVEEVKKVLGGIKISTNLVVLACFISNGIDCDDL
jgi:hypothetical protein